MKKFLAFVLAGATAVVALAGSDFPDLDPANNVPAGAGVIPITSIDSAVAVANLVGVGDVDWYQIGLVSGEVLTAITTPLGNLPLFSDPDTVMAVFAADGTTILTSNDDAGAGFGSAVRWQATYTGVHYIAVSGFPDFGFTGAHAESGPYALTVSVVPEPAALGLILAGLAFVLRRR